MTQSPFCSDTPESLADVTAMLSKLLYTRPADIDVSGLISTYGKCRQLNHLLYLTLHDRLPADWKKEFAPIYRNSAAAALREEAQLLKLYDFLEKQKIRFAPIKGADLAYRIYPAPALRPHGDWDLLIHPDDIKRAEEALKQANWSTDNDGRGCPHHGGCLYRSGQMLEAHFSLSNFDSVNPLELWEEIRLCENSRYRHRLSPELNLLMLTRHAATNEYCHVPYIKLLPDIAYLLKSESPDWDKLYNLSRRWHLPYPGNILGAFPEFFPEEILRACHQNPLTAKRFRAIFETTERLKHRTRQEWVRSEENFGTFHWWKIRLSALTPAVIRAKYKLPASGAGLSLFYHLGRDFAAKTMGLLRYALFPNREIRNFRRLIRLTEAEQ